MCGKQDIASGNGIMRDYEECIVCGMDSYGKWYEKNRGLTLTLRSQPFFTTLQKHILPLALPRVLLRLRLFLPAEDFRRPPNTTQLYREGSHRGAMLKLPRVDIDTK